PDARHADTRARRHQEHGQFNLQRSLDLVRDTSRDAAAARERERIADRCPARGPTRRGCASAADRAMACSRSSGGQGLMEKLMAFFAILILAGFLGILLWKVPRLDLAVLIAMTCILVIWDIVGHGRRAGKSG